MVKSEEPWEFVSRYVGFHEGMSDGLVDDTGRVGVLEGSDRHPQALGGVGKGDT